MSLIASVFMGLGTLFLILSVGIYVWKKQQDSAIGISKKIHNKDDDDDERVILFSPVCPFLWNKIIFACIFNRIIIALE